MVDKTTLEVEKHSKYRAFPWWDAILTLLGALLLLLLIAYTDTFAYLWPLRLLLGLAFVLFVPGYWLVTALFPRDDAIDGIQRLALSFGLSIAVVPPIALILDRLPWGIFLWPIVIAYAVYYAVFIPLAAYRRLRLPAEQRFVPHAELDLKGWWAAQDRVNRVIYFVLLVAFLLAATSAAAIILLPKPGERFTEFYILGPDGLAESYPRSGVAGQPLSVTMGITNREGQAAVYRLTVRDGTGQIATAGPFQVQDGATLEQDILFAPQETAQDVKVEFFLYRDQIKEPYRSLRLWLNVDPP